MPIYHLSLNLIGFAKDCNCFCHFALDVNNQPFKFGFGFDKVVRD